jgi:P27 family predicted phage terminase small subunit
MRILYKVPEEFHSKAKKFMTDLVRQLNKDDLIIKLDTAALILLGDAYNKYFEAQDILLREGFMLKDKNDHQKPHPALKICHESQVEVMKLLIEFGLTPKRRKKAVMPEKKQEMAPIDKYINDHREVR